MDSQRRDRPLPRQAFSLMELLVVIGILALLATISIGAMSANRRVDALVATRQLVADAVRQARHTARTGGAPVVLTFTTDPVAKRTYLGGMSRVLVWHEEFEETQWQAPAIGAALQGPPVIGLTGFGYQPQHPTFSHIPPGLEPSQQIRRGGRSDGFLLAIDVLPPLATSSATIAPLIVLGTANGQLVESLAGIQLVKVVTETVSPSVNPLINATKGHLAQRERLRVDPSTASTFKVPLLLHTWEIQGWVVPQGAQALDVSSWDPADTPAGLSRVQGDLHQSALISNQVQQDIASPLAGGAWVSLALLYDGERLILYRQGRRIGVRTVGPLTLPPGCDQIFIGSVQYDGTANPTFANTCAFDNPRLERLGTDRMGTLPGGVMLTSAAIAQIICHPDGRVENAQATAATDSLSLTFTDPGAGKGSSTIKVSTDGLVTDDPLALP